MSEEQVVEEPVTADLPPTSFIRDKNGVLTEVVDEKSREMIKALGSDQKPVGNVYLTTSEADNPALAFGGTWELLATHMFQGWYVYERLA